MDGGKALDLVQKAVLLKGKEKGERVKPKAA